MGISTSGISAWPVCCGYFCGTWGSLTLRVVAPRSLGSCLGGCYRELPISGSPQCHPRALGSAGAGVWWKVHSVKDGAHAGSRSCYCCDLGRAAYSASLNLLPLWKMEIKFLPPRLLKSNKIMSLELRLAQPLDKCSAPCISLPLI